MESTEHRQAAHSRLSTVGKKFFNLIEFDDQEELVVEIRKHPFGLFLTQLIGFSIAAIIGIIPIVIAFNLNSLSTGEASPGIKSLLIFMGMILALLAIGATFISAIIYTNNVIYVTTEKIAQVLYLSIFNRKMSQLSIGDVQDATVSQKGIFPRIFNYGTLVIETAGEQQNYTFTYVPKPYENARAIVNAHEENLKLYGN